MAFLSRSQLDKYRQQSLYWSTVALNRLPSARSKSVYVLGHPKSGSNWYCKLLSHYLELPIYEAWTTPFPSLGPVILHMHRFAIVPARTAYLLRDGRDIVTSYYFSRTRKRVPVFVKPLEKLCPAPFTAENVRENLPAFIDFLFTKNRAASIPYDRHVREAKRLQLFTVRYEDLLQDGEATLSSAIQFLTGSAAEPARVRESLEQFDFERVTGREHGTEDRNSFVRKGVAGDWRNYFTPEAARVFRRHAGDVLVEAGYEKDSGWVDQVV